MRIGRNQYLIAAHPVDGVDCSRVIRAGKLYVCLGDDCRSTLHSRGDTAVLLLGYAVDADAPEQDERAMCARLLDAPDAESAWAMTAGWGGRWILCLQRGGELTAWTDACGLKQMFYQPRTPGCLASQARYLAWLLDAPADPAALEYLEKARRADREYAWPLDATAYTGIRRLLPNHMLSGESWTSRRMLLPDPCDGDAADSVWRILTGGMAAFLRRGAAAVTVTAGLDSRLVLAASAGYTHQVRGFTFRYAGMAEDHADLTVARTLCAQMDISHQVIPCGEPDGDFRDAYMAHAEEGHEYWVQTAQALSSSPYGALPLVKGSCNEINTNPAGLLPDALVTPRVLCRLFGIPATPFSLGIIRRWLAEAGPACRQQRIPLLDLFYWEHRCGSWLAACLNEQDIAGEMYTPFNVRSLMTAVRPVAAAERIPPDYGFFRALLARGDQRWLRLPINPGRYASPVSRWKLALKYGVFSGGRKRAE